MKKLVGKFLRLQLINLARTVATKVLLLQMDLSIGQRVPAGLDCIHVMNVGIQGRLDASRHEKVRETDSRQKVALYGGDRSMSDNTGVSRKAARMAWKIRLGK